MRVSVIGLGAMGARMARVLVEAGHKVAGYDRSPEAGRTLAALGGRAAHGLADACAGTEALVLTVLNASQVYHLLLSEGALEALPADALVMCCVTMPDAVEIGQAVEASGRRYLDAPISGGTAGADAGRLTFMPSGSDAAFDVALPLMDAMGSHVFRCGDLPGPGSTMKMVHQLAAGANLAVLAEVLSFGTHLGLPADKLLEVLEVSAGGSWMISDRGQRALTDGTACVSAIDIWLKDLGIVLDAAKAAKLPLPIASAAHQVFVGAASAGFGKFDDSHACRFYEALGGAPVRQSDDGTA